MVQTTPDKTPVSSRVVNGRMGRRVTRPSEDPLMQGSTVKQTFSVPAALLAHLREIALDDRFTSLSEYVSHLLLAAIRQREAEKSELARADKKKK